MHKLVNVHYLDKTTFMLGNDDEGEEAMVFDTSPSFDDLVVKVRSILHWNDPNAEVKLIGRYDVGLGLKSRLKSLPITSQLHWNVYKDKVDGSQDKSLEIFATKVDPPPLQIDLNRNASSPIHDGSAEVYVSNCSSNASAIVLRNDAIPLVQEDASGHVCDDAIVAQEDVYLENEEIHYNAIGNLDVIVRQQDMDRTLPYNRMCGYDSDDEGPEEELDEDGFTAQENEIYKKVTGKERGPPLFRDVSLADNAVVDGGMRLRLFEPTSCPNVSDPRPKNEDENAYLKKGIKFCTLQEYKIWLCDYAIRNHRPFVIGHSNQNIRYTLKCEHEGCPWRVRGRKIQETGQWVLKSCVATHTCIPRNLPT